MFDHDHATDSVIRCDAADGGGPIEVDRLDRFEIDRAGGELLQSRARPDGSWLLQGRVAKAGILRYPKKGGGEVRELVDHDVLSDPESLATLERATVTLEHPRPLGTMVDAKNARKFLVGDVGGDSTAPAVSWDAEGGYVVASMCVRTDDALSAVRQGKVELSAGYRATVDPTPGKHPVFGEYDVRQTKRRYNHVAITDTGRAGHDVRLRVDSAGNLTEDTMINNALLALAALLGLTRLDSEEHIREDAAKLIPQLRTDAAEKPALVAKVTELEASNTAQKVRLDAAEAALSCDGVEKMIGEAMDAAPPADPAKATEAEKRMDSVRRSVSRHGTDRAKMVSMVEALRVDSATSETLADEKIAQLGNAALRRLIVTTVHPTAPATETDAYYRARFDALVEDSASRVDSVTVPSVYSDMSRAAQERLDAAGAGKEANRTDSATAKPKKLGALGFASVRKLNPASAGADV